MCYEEHWFQNKNKFTISFSEAFNRENAFDTPRQIFVRPSMRGRPVHQRVIMRIFMQL